MKNTKELAMEMRIQHWAEKMRERRESGLSIKAYCEREGMPPNRYFYWQRRLRRVVIGEMAPRKTETTVPVPIGWTQLSTAEELPKEEKSEVQIEIGKCRIRANECTDTELLTKVCKVLVELC